LHVVATAGHVDHGKSTLVLALTGMDPDRFAEEKARGLTIDLGFAWTTLPSGRELAFVDVPGHVRFLKNMLAGVGAVDACLFVVAATEGWKPQSEEHLRILELLGVAAGVVAVTKVGPAGDPPDLAPHFKGTFLEGAEVVPVDAPAGRGLDAVAAALDRLLAATPTAADRGRPRLWVDRSFAAKGSGTVVTGTLAGGSLRVGDEVVVGPAGLRARVRGLQSHRSALDEAGPGRRLAVNLSGVSHHQVERGHAVVRPGQWEPTTVVDCTLAILPAVDHDVSRRGAYQAYVGSGEYPVKVRLLGPVSAVEPGTTGLARLHLPVALPLLPGDRYVLRESGRSETVGGGEVLDVAPVLPAPKAAPTRSVERVVAERGWVEADVLERLTGERRPPNVAGRWVADPAAVAAMADRLRAAVAAAGPHGLDVAGLDPRERAVLNDLGVAVEGGRAGAQGPSHAYVAALDAAPFTPPTPEEAGVSRADVRELVRRGLVVERDGVFFSSAAVDAAAGAIVRLLVEHPEGVTVAQVRDALGTSRKFLLPLLTYLDASGVTRRRGDLRQAGPRAPRTT
jgi:selenocysteine-specific elongation factor